MKMSTPVQIIFEVDVKYWDADVFTGTVVVLKISWIPFMDGVESTGK